MKPKLADVGRACEETTGTRISTHSVAAGAPRRRGVAVEVVELFGSLSPGGCPRYRLGGMPMPVRWFLRTTKGHLPGAPVSSD